MCNAGTLHASDHGMAQWRLLLRYLSGLCAPFHFLLSFGHGLTDLMQKAPIVLNRTLASAMSVLSDMLAFATYMEYLLLCLTVQ